MLRALVVVASFVLLACGAEPRTPEEEIRTLFEEAEIAAEARDIDVLEDMVSEDYGDAHGHDKLAVKRVLIGHFFRNDSIHLFTQVLSIDVTSPRSASARVLVAMAGQPIEDRQALVEIRADLYRFDLKLARGAGDTWLVEQASYRRVAPTDFL